ncbi:hypothetical protein C8R46DRAFT_1116299 [Mycena filopes]|nr:hypothetical protein C8R46DRAFT_1116299 [Mycena filopes]
MPETELARVEDLWFPTADLILRAENTLFRVYGGILSARSAVFRDMAAFPQPAQPEGEVVDGVAVVRLHDPASEATVFLRAIFDSSFFTPPHRAELDTVIGILRLAHKYDVAYLFRRALSYLDQMYPCNLEQWVVNTTGTRTDHLVQFTDGVETHLLALRAASQVGALWLLPAAYYRICGYPAAKLFAAGPWNTLAVSQQQNCLQAQVELIRGTASIHEFLVDLPVDDCEDEENCRYVLAELRSALASWSRTHRDLNPLGDWVFSDLDPEEGLCAECSDSLEAQHGGAQSAFWLGLPHIFGLPDWEQLLDMRRAVMEDSV